MTREKELFQKMGITKKRKIIACIAEGIYVLIFLVAKIWGGDINVEVLLSVGVIILAIALNYMIIIKEKNEEKQEFAEILRYYPVDGNRIYKIIRNMIGKLTLVHCGISIAMVLLLGRTERLLYAAMIILPTGIFTALGYWIGYGRAMKEDRGREASMLTSLSVCIMLLYPLLLFLVFIASKVC